MSVSFAGRKVDQDGSCIVIAEAGSNHDGKLSQALELIDAAASAGADAVKFQLFTAAELYPPNCGIVDTPVGPRDFFDLLAGLELPVGWLPTLKARAEDQGIAFLATPFDMKAADRLLAVGVPAIKVASPELSHLPLLTHLAGTMVPLILSTGMATLGDIEEALDALGPAVARAVLLHCVSGYPTPPEQANLLAIRGLHDAFARPVGLSDHTLDPIAAPAVATALGAAMVEKHFTVSRKLDGPDHSFSVEPDELAAMVAMVRSLAALPIESRLKEVETALGPDVVRRLLGSPRKRLAPVERELAAVDRRSLHARSEIVAGDRLTLDNVAVLRGERNLVAGLHPRYLPHLLGARATRTIDLGQGITWDDVLVR